MPYTSPSRQSTAVIAPAAPDTRPASRSNSHHSHGPTVDGRAATASHQHHLPRSLSSKDFMYKHRRSPSYSKEDAFKSADEAAQHNKQINGHSPKHIPIGGESSPPKDTFLPVSAAGPDSNEKRRKKKKERPSFRLDNLAELEEALRRTLNSKPVSSPHEDEV